MYQKIVIVGNLGKDPDMRYTPNGSAVCNFSVATNRTYTTSDGNKVEEVTWFRITTWQKLAELCNQYLSKGRKVLVEGRINSDENGSPRIWTRDDGTPAASFEVTAEEVRFLSPKNGDSADEGPAEEKEEVPAEDIPF